MRSINAQLDRIVNLNVVRTNLVQDMSEAVHVVARVTRSVVLLNDHAAMEAELAKLNNARAKYNEALRTLQALPASPEGLQLRQRILEAQQVARPLTDQVLALARQNQDEEATRLLMSTAGPATQKWQDIMDEYVELQKVNNSSDATAAKQMYDRSSTLMLGLSCLALVLGLAAAVVIARGLLRQLGGEPGYAAFIAERIASGDLTVEVSTRGGNEASMLHAIKTMRDSLASIVREVRAGTETIASASTQIATGNQDLSARTEEQASSLEETASSMEELTSAVRQNSEHARQANQLARSASEVAGQGGSVVSQVVGTMASINASSNKIVDIIAVIDGIAFQTNILALNAAVEAARAGEQGRGFAVVASEVRTLAQRSAAAAKEIKELIGDSVEKVQTGSRLVEEAGKTMDEIVASVRRVTDIMGEISTAGDEQQAGIEQINVAVVQMDTVTQQNAALVEEAAAAAEAMQEQAANLERVVSIFKLEHDGAVRRPPAKPAAKAAARPALPAKTAAAAKPAPRLASATKPAATASARNDEWEEF
jgi:methyl-accepting chemotaxis protein